jgi:hypothetical protein
MPRLNAPCEKHGIDCPRRVVGCRTDCTEWQEYEKAKAEQYKAGFERFNKEKQYYNYRFDGITKTLRRKKAEGRK